VKHQTLAVQEQAQAARYLPGDFESRSTLQYPVNIHGHVEVAAGRDHRDLAAE
jgi:hypothetical protein